MKLVEHGRILPCLPYRCTYSDNNPGEIPQYFCTNSVAFYLERAFRLCFCLIIAVSIIYACQSAAQEDSSSTPLYNFEPVSTEYGVILAAQNISVIMRDEVSIALDIYRPNDELEHSSLYAAGPYPHAVDILTDQHSEAGALAWYVSQGYAVVVANVRGTGPSGGDFSFFARDEQQDHYEIIEWIAEQSWSDGQVAGTGAGYYGTAQWQMAIQNPPHLECIAPINGSLDPLRDLIYFGGLSNNLFISNWYDRKIRLANAYSSDSPRLVNYDLRLEQLNHQFDDPYWQIRSSLNTAEQINVPVFAIHDWSMDQTQADIRGSFQALAKLNVINKALIAIPSSKLSLNQDTEFLARELLPYYDWCFTGRTANSTFVEKPQIRYAVKGLNRVINTTSWPPENMTHAPWFLNSNILNASGTNNDESNTPDSEISTKAPELISTLNQQQAGNLASSTFSETSDIDSDIENEEAGNAAHDDKLIRFVSPPLDEDLVLAGPLMLELYASSSSDDLAVEITLYEEQVARAPATPAAVTATITVQRLPSFMAPLPQAAQVPDQTSAQQTLPVPAKTNKIMVSKGMLKASARAIDESMSSEFSPIYSLSEKQPLRPDLVYRLDIALRQIAYRFSAGNKLILEIRPANDGSLSEVDAPPTIYHNGRYPSRLWLPVIQNARTGQQNNVPAENPGQGAASESTRFFVPR